MKKRSDGAAREAARRARQPAKPPSRPAFVSPEIWERMQAEGITAKAAVKAIQRDAGAQGPAPYVPRAPLTTEQRTARTLASLRSTVRSLEAARRRLDEEVRRRDVYVGHLRDAGWSWEQIAAEVGVSRQALRKRAPATPPGA